MKSAYHARARAMEAPSAIPTKATKTNRTGLRDGRSSTRIMDGISTSHVTYACAPHAYNDDDDDDATYRHHGVLWRPPARDV